MSHQQLDSGANPVVQHFLLYVEEQTNSGVHSTADTHVKRPFVKPQAIVDYFADRERAQKLLQEARRGYEDTLLIKDVLRSHTIVFAILLCIGKAEHIKNFTRWSALLADEKLPFESRPGKFPIATNDPHFFEAFFEKQWLFCAHHFYEGHDAEIAVDEILPFTSCFKIGEGGTAAAYRIEIDPTYDHLPQERGTMSQVEDDQIIGRARSQFMSNSARPSNVYVVKVYTTEDSKSYYDSEISAFRRLIEDSGESCPNIIGYYGSFTQGNTHNVLLEWADQGTLEEYFKRGPPTKSEDILLFWERLFGVVSGLRCIHEARPGSGDGPSIFRGWHQDVKPRNILVCSRSSDPYDCDFKLADLGLSHFKEEQEDSAGDIDTNGTLIYGAPECCRNKFNDTTKLTVRQNVDIWSLGCVFSEAAVWVVQGKTGLKNYHMKRCNDADRHHDKLPDRGCFHDGKKVLSSVTETHAEVSQQVRERDFVTKKVIGWKEASGVHVHGLVHEMLSSANRRPTAAQTHGQVEDIVEEAERALKSDHIASPTRRQTELFRDRMLPPVLPPHSLSAPESLGTEQRLSEPGFQEALEQERQIMSSEPSNLYSSPNSDALTGNVTPSVSPLAIQKKRQHTPHESIDNTTPEHHAAQAPVTSNMEDDLMNTNSNGANGLGIDVPQARSPEIVRTSNSGVRSASDALHVALAQRPPVPHRTVQDLQLYLHGRKEDPHAHQLRDNEKSLSTELEKRDYVFLIDDSGPMHVYWKKEFLDVFHALFELLVPYDTNGIDVYFTMSSGKHNWKNVRDAAGYIKNKRPSAQAGLSDVSLRLGEILYEYRDSLESNTKLRRSKLMSKLTKAKKPVTVIVLTDGRWQDQSNPAEIIRDTVGTVVRLEKGQRQVGIEFVRFGSDEMAIKRLETLDNDLGLRLDIVDTEPSHGNVWKMLLGSINKTFDANEKL